MKFSTALLTAGLALTANAALMKRQGEVYQEIIKDINTSVDNMASLVSSFKTAEDAAAIQDASDALVAQIKAGTETAKGAEPMNDAEGFALVQTVTSLVEDVVAVITQIVDRKDEVVEVGYGGPMKAGLSAQFDASEGLAKVLVSKTPEVLQGAAQALAAQISDAINVGVEAYKDVEDGPAPTGGEPTGEPTASPTAEPTDEPTASPTAEPTDGPTASPTAEPTDEEPTASTPAPTGAPTTTSPPDSPGAGAVNGVSAFGVMAAVAAVLAF